MAIFLLAAFVMGLIVRTAVVHASSGGRLLVGSLGAVTFLVVFVGAVRGTRAAIRRLDADQPARTRPRGRSGLQQAASGLAVAAAVVAVPAGGTVRGAVCVVYGAAALALLPCPVYVLLFDARHRRRRVSAPLSVDPGTTSSGPASTSDSDVEPELL